MIPYVNRIINKAAVSVDTTALGTHLLTSAEQATQGMACIVVNPSVDIALVDGTATGTYANSPFVCPAGANTVILHNGGPLKAISSSGTSTVKVGIGVRQ